MPSIQSLSDATRKLCLFFEPIATAKKIKFVFDIEPDIQVSACQHSLEPMLAKLLSYAFRYTPSGKQVTLVLQSQRNTALIRVKDAHPEISQGKLRKIFQIFTQAPNMTRENIEEIGLDLALAKLLIKQHHWQAYASYDLDQGNELQVHIPKIALATSTARPSGTDNHEKARLLVIDDTQGMRQYFGQVLQRDFDCLFAENGKKGLDLTQIKLPELIIYNLRAPEHSEDPMDPESEVLMQLRNNLPTSHIPILILLASDRHKEVFLSDLARHVDDYIEKPFGAEEFKTRIQSFLSVRDMRQQKLMDLFLKGGLDLSNTLSTAELSPRDKTFMEKLEFVVEKHYPDADMNVEKLAEHMHISPGHLLHKLKTLIGKGPKDLLMEYRIFKAGRLLQTQPRSIADIAEAVGFKNQRHFSTSFKKIVKYTPSEYRRISLTPLESNTKK